MEATSVLEECRLTPGRLTGETGQPKACGLKRSIVHLSLAWVPPQSEGGFVLSLFCFVRNVNLLITVLRTNCCLGNSMLF